MHHSDADEKLLETSVVPRVLESRLFDHVVLAVADVPENDVLERWAKHWGVEVFRGAERDVARRILDCAHALDAAQLPEQPDRPTTRLWIAGRRALDEHRHSAPPCLGQCMQKRTARRGARRSVAQSTIRLHAGRPRKLGHQSAQTRLIDISC